MYETPGPVVDRRSVLRLGASVAGALLLRESVFTALAEGARVAPGSEPYGPLLPPNADGIQLPRGFRSRLLAVSGEQIDPTSHTWHAAPDGGCCFGGPGGSWVYVSNSEVSDGGGGVSALRFSPDGKLVSAYSILQGTSTNCAGGPTPWKTWLSCEESGTGGRVFECNPFVPGQGVHRPKLGAFNHEAAFVDPVSGHVYLTEDDPSGRFYRFVPRKARDLRDGELFAASVSDGVITWLPTSSTEPARQNGTTAFNGGEGIWIDRRTLYFTTKGDKRVWSVDLRTQRISVFYDGENTPGGALKAVDNVTVHAPSADVYVAEDGGNLEVCVLASVKGTLRVAPFLRFVGHDQSEVTGPAFSPDHRRLYVSSQRGTDGKTGRTYEITGPFRLRTR